MRWDVHLPALLARYAADTALQAALGGNHIYPAGASRPARVPSVEYLLFPDRDGESFNTFGLRLDVFAKPLSLAATIEKRLRVLTHGDVAQVLGSERLWLRYLDARSLDYESDPGVVHRALDFEVESVRLKYA